MVCHYVNIVNIEYSLQKTLGQKPKSASPERLAQCHPDPDSVPKHKHVQPWNRVRCTSVHIGAQCIQCMGSKHAFSKRNAGILAGVWNLSKGSCRVAMTSFGSKGWMSMCFDVLCVMIIMRMPSFTKSPYKYRIHMIHMIHMSQKYILPEDQVRPTDHWTCWTCPSFKAQNLTLSKLRDVVTWCVAFSPMETVWPQLRKPGQVECTAVLAI